MISLESYSIIMKMIDDNQLTSSFDISESSFQTKKASMIINRNSSWNKKSSSLKKSRISLWWVELNVQVYQRRKNSLLKRWVYLNGFKTYSADLHRSRFDKKMFISIKTKHGKTKNSLNCPLNFKKLFEINEIRTSFSIHPIKVISI